MQFIVSYSVLYLPISLNHIPNKIYCPNRTLWHRAGFLIHLKDSLFTYFQSHFLQYVWPPFYEPPRHNVTSNLVDELSLLPQCPVFLPYPIHQHNARLVQFINRNYSPSVDICLWRPTPPQKERPVI